MSLVWPMRLIEPVPPRVAGRGEGLDVLVHLVGAGLVESARDRDAAVGHPHSGGVPAAVRHVRLPVPLLCEGIERVDLVEALPAGGATLEVEIAAEHHELAVGGEGVPRAPDVGGLQLPVLRIHLHRRVLAGDRAGGRVPQVGLGRVLPFGHQRIGEEHHLARGKQRRVDRHDRQGLGGAEVPAPDLGGRAHLGGGNGGGLLCALARPLGPASVGAAGDHASSRRARPRARARGLRSRTRAGPARSSPARRSAGCGRVPASGARPPPGSSPRARRRPRRPGPDRTGPSKFRGRRRGRRGPRWRQAPTANVGLSFSGHPLSEHPATATQNGSAWGCRPN